MCDCLQHVAKKLSLDDVNHSEEDKIQEIREPAYTLIHCSTNDWKNIGIPITPDGPDTSSSNSKLSSSGLSNNWQCNCNNVTDKFNVIATRVNRKSENAAKEDDNRDELDIEYTLAIIKPEAMKYKNAIRRKITEEGFQICQEKILKLSPEQASELYSKEYGKLSFPLLAVYMSSGPITVYVLAKNNAVNDWRRLMGPRDVNEAKWCFPNSIRAIFGENGGIENVVHGSATREEAVNEIHFFFPNFIVEPLFEEQRLEDYLRSTVYPVLIEGLSRLCKERPRDPVIWLADWLTENNPNKPKILLSTVKSS